jgi:hypothetical protein
MPRPDPRDDDALLRDAAGRAGALRDGFARDRASVAGWAGWPEGPALYDEALGAVERLIAELGGPAESRDTSSEGAER